MKMYINLYCELRVVVVVVIVVDVGKDWHRTNYFFYDRTLIMTRNLIMFLTFIYE